MFSGGDISKASKQELERFTVMLSRPRAADHFGASSFPQICNTVRTLLAIRTSEEASTDTNTVSTHTDRAKARRELQRLIEEAPRIAPSIARFELDHDYGKVTDDSFDAQNFIRWEIEVGAILSDLDASGVSVFRELHQKYLQRAEASRKFHSRSILVHQILELLVSAIQLIDSNPSQPSRGLAKPSELNPWPLVRSFLLRLSSYEVPEIMDRAGLIVDWILTEKENYSHKTRIAAYRCRIDAAYQSLSNNDNRLRVAYIVTRELANRGSTSELNDALREIGWELRDDKLVPSSSQVRELFLPDQSHHDAYVEIRAILQKAKNRIVIVDPYIDQSILTLLSTCAKPGMSIRILTSKPPTDFALEANRWISQHRGSLLEVRTTKEFHDRFVLLDENACWHIGCSIKDAGSKAFMLSELEDHDNRMALLAQVEKSWAAGTVVL